MQPQLVQRRSRIFRVVSLLSFFITYKEIPATFSVRVCIVREVWTENCSFPFDEDKLVTRALRAGFDGRLCTKWEWKTNQYVENSEYSVFYNNFDTLIIPICNSDSYKLL